MKLIYLICNYVDIFFIKMILVNVIATSLKTKNMTGSASEYQVK
jgi:hypothetical protein